MAYDREGYAPWSLTRKAGVQSATVDGDIKVPQYIQPVLDTGFVDEDGNWKGTPSNDDLFFNFQTEESIANGGEVLSNSTINMVQHDLLMFAVRPTNGGNVKFELLISGSENEDTYFNLKPVKTDLLAYTTQRQDAETHNFDFILNVTQSCSADVWNVFKINDCRGLKLIMKLTNNSGGASTIDQAIMRVI